MYSVSPFESSEPQAAANDATRSASSRQQTTAILRISGASVKIAGGDKNDGGRKWIEAKPTAAETSTKNSAAATGYGRSGGGKAAERTTPARRSRSGESVGRSCGLPYHIAANASPTPCPSQGAVPAPDPPPPSRRGPAMGSRLHRNDGRRRRTHIVIPATGDLCTTVIPAQAGIQVWVPR